MRCPSGSFMFPPWSTVAMLRLITPLTVVVLVCARSMVQAKSAPLEPTLEVSCTGLLCAATYCPGLFLQA